MSKNKWRIEDATDSMQGTPSFSVIYYSEELGEEDEVCSVFCNDINFMEQIRNAVMIKNIPVAYSLLESLATRMNANEKEQYQGILSELKSGVELQNNNEWEIDL